LRRERILLSDIMQAADIINAFAAATDRDTFLASDLQQGGMAFQFIIIGEAARQLSDDLTNRYPDIAWAQARGLRNQVVHRYANIDWSLIWESATLIVPRFRAQIADVLGAEFPESDPA
jgi:uncharacterized protein with HEPN domain